SGQLASRLSCGANGGRSRTAVDLYRSIGATNSLVISGSRRSNHVVVDRRPGGYVVTSRTPGGGVRLGERDSGACRHAERPLTFLCAGAVDSILASLGPGADTLAITARVPASVAAVIDGGGGADRLRGGAGD